MAQHKTATRTPPIATPCRIRRAVLAALLAALPASAQSEPICERSIAAAARDYGVPIDILYSIGLTETGHRGELGPYDLNVDGRSVHAATLAEGLSAFAQAEKQGARFVDVGCMQIDHHFHAAHFRSLQEMFDPEHNVRYAASLLKTLREQEGNWTTAVARYNAGPGNPKAQRNYVCAVITHMVQSGLGGWTPNARAYCG